MMASMLCHNATVSTIWPKGKKNGGQSKGRTWQDIVNPPLCNGIGATVKMEPMWSKRRKNLRAHL